MKNDKEDPAKMTQLSRFGQKFARHSGISRLMQDLNEGIRTPGQSKFIPGLGFGVKVPFTTDKAKLEDVINNPRAYPNVNTDLLKTIKADNPNYTYTQVLDQYNRSLPRQRNGEAVFATAGEYRTPFYMFRTRKEEGGNE